MTAPSTAYRQQRGQSADTPPDGIGIGDPAHLSRLRWRCRRGMLENDLVLARFIDARGTSLSVVEMAALNRALDLPDSELWDLIARRTETDDPALAPIVALLREA